MKSSPSCTHGARHRAALLVAGLSIAAALLPATTTVHAFQGAHSVPRRTAAAAARAHLSHRGCSIPKLQQQNTPTRSSGGHRFSSGSANTRHFDSSSSSAASAATESLADEDESTSSPTAAADTPTNSNSSGAAPSSSSSSSSSGSNNNFANFDYPSQWYPVSFARDVPYDAPHKITLFDVDYVISRHRYVPPTVPPTDDNEGEDEGKNKEDEKPPNRIRGAKSDDREQIYAVLDRCPHKSASLSEGRLVTSCDAGSAGSAAGGGGGGEAATAAAAPPPTRFQCAYHGWTFDGYTGRCVDIPQVTASEGGSKAAAAAAAAVGGGRADTTAVPALVQQGIIYLFPGGNLERALLVPPPPRVPELDMEGYRMVPAVRDFPVDWAILLENIMDPDHGLFAHQAPPFDMYTASKDYPQMVTEEFGQDGKGWTLRGSVDAVDKLTAYDKRRRLEEVDDKLAKKLEKADADDAKDAKDAESESEPLRATTTFYAPTHIVLARKDEGGNVASQTVFWVSPTGTGRSRFMSTFVPKLPPFFPLPRWLGHVILNNFLDQDTHLLLTAQKYVLDAEAKALVDAEKKEGDEEMVMKKGTNARRNLFVYRSPTEKLQARLCSFFDKTLPRVPNRAASLRSMAGISKTATPSREFSLDRYEQHTKICPDSQDCVKNCDRIVTASKVGSALLVATKAILSAHSNPAKWMTKVNSGMLAPRALATLLGVAALTTYLANKLRNAFFFNYPESKRDRDMAKIPSVWKD